MRNYSLKKLISIVLVLSCIIIMGYSNVAYSVLDADGDGTVSKYESLDIETAEMWEKTLPEKLKGSWGKRLVQTARSQIGYRESKKNQVSIKGMVKPSGYTRYGDFCGNDHGEWCAMFIIFCLHYAGVPEEALPVSENCDLWKRELISKGLFEYTWKKSDNYIPKQGDIVFLGHGDSFEAQHAGIVTYCGEGKPKGSDRTYMLVRTIEGNVYCEEAEGDIVCEREYLIFDDCILGYANIQKAESVFLKKDFSDTRTLGILKQFI